MSEYKEILYDKQRGGVLITLLAAGNAAIAGNGTRCR